jgi:hypothetical protein
MSLIYFEQYLRKYFDDYESESTALLNKIIKYEWLRKKNSKNSHIEDAD